MNIRGSKRGAKPVRPVFSRAEPTWYHMFVDTSGTALSSWRITVSPFGSVNCVYLSSSFGGADCAVCARAGVAIASAAERTKAADFIRGDFTAIAPGSYLRRARRRFLMGRPGLGTHLVA